MWQRGPGQVPHMAGWAAGAEAGRTGGRLCLQRSWQCSQAAARGGSPEALRMLLPHPPPKLCAFTCAGAASRRPLSLCRPRLPAGQVKCKEEIWNMMNREWLEKQAAKKAAQASTQARAPLPRGAPSSGCGGGRRRHSRRAGSWCRLGLANRLLHAVSLWHDSQGCPATPLAGLSTRVATLLVGPPALCRRPRRRLLQSMRRLLRPPRLRGCSTSAGVVAPWAPRPRARRRGWRTCRPQSRRRR